ncbi:cytochrome c oxidase subunit II [Comamonas antarctica]|uniref:Cytochrome aa3 subunit 2 n=1 Tax=Comamonas antarctica TaxID=2743470 RepID=A0A6N1X6J6_9BURK|nr:cytochrome c oxidase subunit II [Comamonas antarctica]QKV53475.1 cytochrome c oxidase subunit II [Comamonas antarctica]
MKDGAFFAAGDAAQTIETVTWVLIGGGLLIFIGVMLLLAWSLRTRASALRPRLWVIGGGVVFPALVLTALFVWVLPRMPAWKPVPPADALIVTVNAHMWWWEVRYRDPATGADVRTANEIRIPVGRPVYFALTSADVIHSFWVPQLAGKMDMLPGRMQHLLVTAKEPGVWRGQCAEFCGAQHAQMALHVVGLEPQAFDAWLAAQARPAPAPASARQELGRSAFVENRCNACHTVRGVSEQSRLGPDLTHFGSRLHLGAGMLANTPEGRERWLTHIQQIKTGARMPSYDRLDPATLDALGDWLGSLQ